MWTQNLCLICIYILRNYAFQISNEALFLAFLQPVANRLKSFIPPSRRLGKTSSGSTFNRSSGVTRMLLLCYGAVVLIGVIDCFTLFMYSDFIVKPIYVFYVSEHYIKLMT